MSDSFTVKTSQSWFSRIAGAFAGVIFGLILFLAAFVLLIWNEGRAIKRAQTLDAGLHLVQSVPVTLVDPANAGKLVHITGLTVVSGTVTDPIFGVTVPAIKLHRDVEMYQWSEEKKSETRKTLGGGEETVTTYDYKKVWSSDAIDSSAFQKPDGHLNPEMEVSSETYAADDVTVGAFTLSDSLIGMIQDYTPLPISKDATPSDELSLPVQVASGKFYVGKDPAKPAIGDLRVSFDQVKPGEVSIVAKQIGNTFEPYPIKNLGEIELLQSGTFSAESMFASEQQSNKVITWILRLVGFIMMAVGISLVTKPLSVLADVIPFIGNLAEAGLGFVAFLIALPLTLGTVAVAWLAYRPLIGLPLLVIAVVGIFFAAKALWKRRTPKQVTA